MRFNHRTSRIAWLVMHRLNLRMRSFGENKPILSLEDLITEPYLRFQSPQPQKPKHM